MKKLTLLMMSALCMAGATTASAETEIVCDTITPHAIQAARLVNSPTATMNGSYFIWSGLSKDTESSKVHSNAVYSGETANGNVTAQTNPNYCLQMNNTDGRGIWSTVSGGKVKKVTAVTFPHNSTNSFATVYSKDREVKVTVANDSIYGSNGLSKTEFNTVGAVSVAGTEYTVTEGDVHTFVVEPKAGLEGDFERLFIAATKGVIYFQYIIVEWEREVEAVEPPVVAPEWCIPTGNAGFSGRYVSGLTVRVGDAEAVAITGCQTNVTTKPYYYDKTENVIVVKPGDAVNVAVQGAGEWMHNYLFVDYNNDGTFTPSLAQSTSIPNEGSELVSHTGYYYTGNKPFYNSKGVICSTANGSAGNTDYGKITDPLPEFTIPAGLAPGDYRARYKMSWNSVDPCGVSDDTSNPASSKGGAIIDFTFRVEAAVAPQPTEFTVTRPNAKTEGGLILLQMKPSVKQLNYGENIVPANAELTVSVTKNAGYTDYTGTVTINGDTLDFGMMSSATVVVDKDMEFDVTFEAPAKEKYALTINNAASGLINVTYVVNGSTVPLSSGSRVEEGTEITISATPAAGYQLKKITANDTEFTTSPATYTVTSATTIGAEFEAIPKNYTVTYSQVEGGTLQVLVYDEAEDAYEAVTSGREYPENTSLFIYGAANEGYTFTRLLVNDAEVAEYEENEAYELVLTENVTIAIEVEEAGEPVKEYCTVAGTTNRDRWVGALKVNNGTDDVTVTACTSYYNHNYYYDKTDVVVAAKAGDVITVTPTAGSGEWMMGYLYVDFDNNGVFDVDMMNTAVNGDLVSHQGYSLDRKPDGSDTADPTTQSDGSAFNSANINGRALPSFTLPVDMAAGDYRVRYKLDWNSTDPCGRHTDRLVGAQKGNLMTANGGEIIDFTLRIEESETPAPTMYTVTWATGLEGGKIQVFDAEDNQLTNGVEVEEGTKIYPVAVENLGYEMVSFTYGENVEVPEELTVESNIELTAEFSKISTVLTVVISGEGTVTVADEDNNVVADGESLDYGSVYTVTATPANEGIIVESILIDGVVVEGNTFTAESDVTVSVTFANKPGGIEYIRAAISEGARLFNLQGMEVEAENVVPGIYVVRTATSATKVYVK